MGVRALTLALLLVACGGASDDRGQRTSASPPAAPPARAVLAPHPDYITAGPPRQSIDTVTNPFAGDENAIAAGGRLYEQYNCVSCHGGEGAGGIGPTLNDPRWKYGGTPAEIFQSIYEGRPEGMPMWGGRIPDEQIWQLSAYLESLVGEDMATVNWPGVPAEAGRRTPVR
ncbi:MAG TPA: c-type cytochrome [Longimicrobiales bacterium]|nr:c-type cytochrome [Longimicrobiales bacterium]